MASVTTSCQRLRVAAAVVVVAVALAPQLQDSCWPDEGARADAQ